MIAEKCPNLGKETDVQIQEAKRVPNNMNPNRSTSRHIVIKWQKLKIKKNLKTSKGKSKLVMYKGTPVSL